MASVPVEDRKSEVVGKRWLWVGAALWATSIFITSCGLVTTKQLSHAVSTVAGGHISESGFLQFWGVVWWVFVKGWHATEFGILFLLIRRAIPRSLNWSAGLAASYAFLDEAHQLFVPYRGCRLSDVCIDCLGILAAWVLAEWVANRKGRQVVPKLKSLFSHPWLLTGLTVGWIALVFVLSIFPFGLVTLDSNAAGNFPRP